MYEFMYSLNVRKYKKLYENVRKLYKMYLGPPFSYDMTQT